MKRQIEVQELIQLLLETRQPHAKVEVQGRVAADNEEGYYDVDNPIIGLHSKLGKVVLEIYNW